MGKAPQCVAAGTILDSTLHDLGPQLLSHGHLLTANPDISAAVKDSLRGSLNKHLGSVSDPGGLLRCAVAGHALPVPGELKGEVLLPLGVQVLLHNLGLFQTSSRLGHAIGVNFLSQGDQGSLSSLTNLLKDLLEVVEVNGRVIAHHRDGGHLFQGFKVGTLDLLSVVEDIAYWLVGGSRDFKLLQVSSLIGESEHLAHRHHGGDDGGEALRDGSDGEGNSNLEVVDGTLDPGTTVGGVVEVANVDCPDSNADKCDHLGELLGKVIKLLLEGGLDLLGGDHSLVDLTDGSGGTSANDNTPGLA